MRAIVNCEKSGGRDELLGQFSASSRARIVPLFRGTPRRDTHRVVREVRVAVIAVVARHLRKDFLSFLLLLPQPSNNRRSGRRKWDSCSPKKKQNHSSSCYCLSNLPPLSSLSHSKKGHSKTWRSARPPSRPSTWPRSSSRTPSTARRRQVGECFFGVVVNRRKNIGDADVDCRLPRSFSSAVAALSFALSAMFLGCF